MIIGICGHGYTGSGALLDLLKEFEDCSVVDSFEFCFSYIPYGIEDLQTHLVAKPSRYNSSEAAIKDFIRWMDSQNTINNPIQKGTNSKFDELSYQYINSLIDISWAGYSSFDYVHYNYFERKILIRIMRRLLKFFNRYLAFDPNIFPKRKMYFASPSEKEFIEKSKTYIKNIIDSTDADTTKKIVLNQPFEANYPSQSFPYFDQPKAIIVDKDPRDLYLLAKKIVQAEASFIPTGNVVDFIKYYKKLRSNLETENENIMRISFESLVYDYDYTVKKIKNFLNLNGIQNEKKYFDPSISINNTQLFLKYPEFKDDISLIEKELCDRLFNFNKYDIKPNFKIKSF